MTVRGYLTELQRATADGVPVKGYFYWSSMDNLEHDSRLLATRRRCQQHTGKKEVAMFERKSVHGRQTMPRWRPTCLWLLIRGLVFGIGLAAAACDGPMTTDSVNALATSPSTSLPAAGFSAGSSNVLAREGVSFPLLNGMFTITTQGGAQLIGTYVGEMIAPIHGRTSVTLQLTVTDGTGEFDGANGALEAKGSVDADDGTFVLSSSPGVLSTTAEPSGVTFRATVSGTSSLSCSAAGRIVLTLRGQGTGARAGRIDAELSSEIGNTGCVD